jgi:hypothetical protein
MKMPDCFRDACEHMHAVRIRRVAREFTPLPARAACQVSRSFCLNENVLILVSTGSPESIVGIPGGNWLRVSTVWAPASKIHESNVPFAHFVPPRGAAGSGSAESRGASITRDRMHAARNRLRSSHWRRVPQTTQEFLIFECRHGRASALNSHQRSLNE